MTLAQPWLCQHPLWWFLYIQLETRPEKELSAPAISLAWGAFSCVSLGIELHIRINLPLPVANARGFDMIRRWFVVQAEPTLSPPGINRN